jgi:hypothetical protein
MVLGFERGKGEVGAQQDLVGLPTGQVHAVHIDNIKALSNALPLPTVLDRPPRSSKILTRSSWLPTESRCQLTNGKRLPLVRPTYCCQSACDD